MSKTCCIINEIKLNKLNMLFNIQYKLFIVDCLPNLELYDNDYEDNNETLFGFRNLFK